MGVAPVQARAQAQQSVGFLDVGTEKEQVLRVLQILGDVPLYPWSIRQLSPTELDRLRPKNAAADSLLPRESSVRSYGALKLQPLPLKVQGIYNSAFPYGFNDGPIWAGKGATGALSGGVAGKIGPLSFQLEPMIFEAQNAAFQLAPGTIATNPVNAFYPRFIDLPQRFGAGAYRRFDPGQSSARLDIGPIAAEVSTADQWWGPALENPLILGNNAAGFPHGSLMTARPINVGIGYVDARAVWGRLSQSEYSPAGTDAIRFMSGALAVFVPRGVPGLELGGSRFFHSPWPAGGFWNGPFSRPFEGLLKHSLATADNPTGQDADNQLASIFMRWAFPRSGVEFYGEYGREDHNIDLRDLWQEPDHDAGYTIGLQRAWHRARNDLLVVRAEWLNTRLAALEQGRGQTAWYIHESIFQGHTELGQLLGAPAGFGGSGATVAVDSYSAAGRWTLSWDRIARAERVSVDHSPQPLRADVMHAFGIDKEFRRGLLTYTFGGRGVWDLNRDFVADRFNLNLTAKVVASW